MYRVTQRRCHLSNRCCTSCTFRIQRRHQKHTDFLQSHFLVQSLSRNSARHLPVKPLASEDLTGRIPGKKGNPLSQAACEGEPGPGPSYRVCLGHTRRSPYSEAIATVLLNSGSPFAVWCACRVVRTASPPSLISSTQVGNIVNLPENVQSVFMYLVSVLLLVF